MTRERPVSRALAAGGMLIAALHLAGCRVGYVVKSSWFQLELLRSRVPLDDATASGELSERQLQALALIEDVKAFGARRGFAATDNYGSIALHWDRTIHNLVASDPLAFEPATWWFPIVGRVPYLGYFREEDALRRQRKLASRGLDVYVRTAGAYSTLGWFKDPVLLPMLGWSELSLADTVLHELAHATLWVPGSVPFNESFANFVGEVAAFEYLDQRYGPDSDQVRRAHQEVEDYEGWRQLQLELYRDLDKVFTDGSLSPAEKYEQKQLLYTSVATRIDPASFHDPERYRAVAARGPWNNARLVGFRTYNDRRHLFEGLYRESGGEIMAFIENIRELTRGHRDPYVALEEHLSTP